MLKRTASGGEHIVTGWFGHQSRSPNPSPNRNQNRNQNQSPNRSRSPSPNPNPRSNRYLSRRSSRSPNPRHPRSRRGWLPPAVGCLPDPAQQRPRLSLSPTPRPRRPEPPPSRPPSHLRLSRPPLLEPVHRSHARASRYLRPPADRLRLLQASRFPRPLVGVVGVRRRVRAGAHAVQSARQPEPKDRG